MDKTIFMILAFIGGILLGTIFYGGLWFTVKKSIASKIPAFWVLGSFFLRIFITMVGFYYISYGNWQKLLICVLGFIAARLIVMRFTKTMEQKKQQLEKEVGHET
jgi:F1F0 ATPase subunit 2